MIKLSVIVPVYNVEDYLTECIESVLNQIYNGGLELILVDDGSTDQSSYICDYYAAMDSRIKVIHKENSGTSSARNAGIDAATGDYIAFLDSDDFWVENTIHDILKIAEETRADILIGNAIKYLDAEGRFSPYPNNLQYNPICKTTYDKFLYILHPDNRFQWHIWKCIFKADLIKNNRIYFREGLMHQDVEWLPRVLSRAESIEIIDTIFICYRVHSNMTNQEKCIKRHRDLLKAIYYLTSYFQEISMDQKLKQYFYANFAEAYVHVFMRQALLQDKYSRSLLKRLSNYICFYKGKYAKILKLFYNVFGFNNTCKIINITGKTALFIIRMRVYRAYP